MYALLAISKRKMLYCSSQRDQDAVQIGSPPPAIIVPTIIECLPLRAYSAQLGRSTCAKILASIKETEMVEDLEYHILILYEAHNDHFAAA